MDLVQIKQKIKEKFYSFGNDDLYDCFYSLFDSNTEQFKKSIENHYGKKISPSKHIQGIYDFSIYTDSSSVQILIKNNIDLLTNLLSQSHDISEYLTNTQNKLKIFKSFLESASHSDFSSTKFHYSAHESTNKYLIKILDKNLLELEEISQRISTPKNDSIGSRSPVYDSQVSSNYYLSVSNTEITPPPPPPVSPDNGWLGGANSSPIQITQSVVGSNNPYIGAPSPSLSYPSASPLNSYITQFYPPQPLSVSNPVYSQIQSEYPYQSSSVSYVPYLVYSQSQPVQPYGQHPITQPTWNGAYYSQQNTKINQPAPCSLIPFVTYQTPYYHPAYFSTSYPSSPFVSSPPQAAFSSTSPSSPFARATPASVFAPMSFYSIQTTVHRR